MRRTNGTVSGLFTFINKPFLSFSDDHDDVYECKADGEKFKRLEVHCLGSMRTSLRFLSAHTFDNNQSIYHIPWWILIIVLMLR